MHLEGTPSEHLPDVLGTGETAAKYVFISFSGRHPEGRDAEYIEWHSLDHRPEQYRLPDLRNAIRLVSTPACRAARAASVGLYDEVDHVMTYMFTDAGGIPGFTVLGNALNVAGRMAIRLPSITYMTADLEGKIAAARAVAGADVIPWRPAVGVYILVEEGNASPADLVDLPGVAGIWWYQGALAPAPYDQDTRGTQITYFFLDSDPVAAAETLGEAVRKRWETGAVKGLLAAPFFPIVPFEWDRYLPTE
ncbi:hypothetical protein [Sphingomonas solaris]|uniref:Uncharacterized protein n=1 Tax=Alterirhizorhabdus solaris TaxID=2529389 RepID=A0A558R1T8_9SPHN|nr:hypothetical protein [Sphingomonas solaris]TVV73337.1 hypothetical protein FOY91_12410 [Sphingomonas solaris]